MTKCVLDVLIPHYNDVAALDLSLQSVLAQTWEGPMRIVVADDGSDPLNVEMVRALLARLPMDTALIEIPANRGRPYARNVLLDALESPFAAWLDAGDEWYPHKLREQFDVIDSLPTDVATQPYWVTCDYDWKWTGATARHMAQVTHQDQVRALLVGRNLRAYLWTLVAPSSSFTMVGKFDENLPRLQDVDFFLRFVLGEGKILPSRAAQPLCVYHKSDVGRDARQIRQCNEYLLKKHSEVYQQYGHAFVRGRQYDMELLSARFALKNNDYALASYFFTKAFSIKPMSFAKRIIQKGFKF